MPLMSFAFVGSRGQGGVRAFRLHSTVEPSIFCMAARRRVEHGVMECSASTGLRVLYINLSSNSHTVEQDQSKKALHLTL